ncbi:MAG: hypothetical protein AAFY42_09500 [Pseudomonadota bacterium]
MTDTFRGFRAGLVTAAAMSALVTAGCTTTANPSASSGLALGENAAGDPCEATLNWSDPSFGDEFTKSASSYSVGCRGRLGSGTQARVGIFDTAESRDEFTGTLSCSASSAVTVSGFDAASARRCFDPALGLESFVIDASSQGQFYQVSSAANAVGPGVQAIRLLAGLDAGGAVTSDREVDGLANIPAAPSRTVASRSIASFDVNETLGIATRQIFLGNYANASNLLKTALVQVDDTTDPSIAAELLLEAGLADSNIRFFDSATTRFTEAEELLRSPNVNRARILGRKLAIYRGLHALNQRQFAQAKALLSPIIEGQVSGEQPLLDPVGISILNSGLVSGGDVRNALNLPDEEQNRELVLTAQAYWALSVAAIPENDLALARQSLDEARKTVSSITGIERAGVLWLEARLDRQLGRILAAEGDFPGSLTAFDEAINKMTQSSLSGIGTGAEPAMAELTLERASVVERSGASATANHSLTFCKPRKMECRAVLR